MMNISNIANTKNITSLEIDLIDACNLSCPLCNRNKHISKDGYLSKHHWFDTISKYKELKTIYFLGTRSEHTLYPDFLELVSFIKFKKIKIILSTNGDTHNPKWWNQLSELLEADDEVRFAVDGITQESYEIYRVGGNLENVLANHKAFKTDTPNDKPNDKPNDTVQFISFEHNQNDLMVGLQNGFFNQFSRTRFINSSFAIGDIRPSDLVMKQFEILDKFAKRVTPNISCETKDKQHFINYNGDISPCCHFNEHNVLNGIKWDGTYEEIEDAKYDFCTRICDKTCVMIRGQLGIEL